MLLNKIKNYLLAFTIVSTGVLYYMYNSSNIERKRLENNVLAQENVITEINGRYINQSTILTATKEELNIAKKKAKLDSSLLSTYERKLINADKAMKAAGLKIENLEATIMSLTQTIDSFKIASDTAYIDNGNLHISFNKYEDRYWTIELDPISVNINNPNNILVSDLSLKAINRVYQTTFIDRYRAKDGVKVTFLPSIRFWLPYKYESTVIAENPKTQIISNTVIKWE